ncbi:MAG: NAD-dependent DNA ligase LigA [Clostridia bacterium]|nr:NAD-dependent DNA ligase LigA [Clostridia bacterium]
MTDRDRMKELVAALNEASAAYYSGQSEIMSDREWDALFDELAGLEKKTGIVLPDSPTAKVSSESDSGEREDGAAEPSAQRRVRHEYPALSLAKTKQVGDLVSWAGGRPVWLSWKLDGLTLVATYDGGELTSLVTRGNGEEGADITRLAGSISGVPSGIGFSGHLVVRGEAVISYADFEAFVAENGEDYANPRNLASGSLALKDSDEVRRRSIRFVAFTLVAAEPGGSEGLAPEFDAGSWGSRMALLDSLGFSTVERVPIKEPDLINMTAAVDGFSEGLGTNPYPADGLVLVYDDTVYASGGSVTGHHATRAGLAFKWKDESAYTALRYIEWSCAAASITPVAVFEPVELEGTVVKRASLCNVSECERLGIGGAGSELEVIKANKIIPKVVSVRKAVGPLVIPTSCPVCGFETRLDVGASGARVLRCANEKCQAKRLKRYERFVSKPALDVDGLSINTIARFISEGYIRSFADILRLDSREQEIAQLEDFGEKSAANIAEAVKKSRRTTVSRLLFALSIPTVGQEAARLLAKSGSLDELIVRARSGDDKVFSAIEGFGDKTSKTVCAWFCDPENEAELSDLLPLLELEDEQAETSDELKGLTFVITGDVERFRNRGELKAWIIARGGKVAGTVSKNTDYLINNDPDSSSTKNRRAAELGVPVIPESALFGLAGGEKEADSR